MALGPPAPPELALPARAEGLAGDAIVLRRVVLLHATPRSAAMPPGLSIVRFAAALVHAERLKAMERSHFEKREVSDGCGIETPCGGSGSKGRGKGKAESKDGHGSGKRFACANLCTRG